MNAWLKDNAPIFGAFAALLLALVAAMQLVVVGPMNRGFDDLRSEMQARFEAVDHRFETVDQRFGDLRSEMRDGFAAVDQRFADLRSDMNQRLEAVDQRLGRLEDAVSELRTLSDRVSRNRGQIRIIREQLQTVDAPAP